MAMQAPDNVASRFTCQFAGCTRSFSRQEHLQRHVLNHAEVDYTCERCRTVFKRPDLLGEFDDSFTYHISANGREDRHMTRHRQKDAEGGTLMTRKRLWKDPEGRIVNKKPAREKQRAATVVEIDPNQVVTQQDFPPSPPKSASDAAVSPEQAVSNDTFQQFYGQPDLESQQQTTGTELFNDDLLSNDLFSANYDAGNITSGPFDDIFMPDTASSFNMPYTTMSNYSWLFDITLDPALSTPEEIPLKSRPGSFIPNNDLIETQAEANRPTMSESTPVSENIRVTNTLRDITSDQPELSNRTTNSRLINLNIQDVSRTSNSKSNASCQPADTIESPMCLLHPDQCLPQLDDLAYERLIDLIEQARPSLPDGSLVTFDHPLLSLPQIQRYLDLYFTRFNTAYPLIHLPTFDASQTEPLLSTSMILLGATYESKDAHQLAVCIHDVLRPQIFSSHGFSAKPELWILQTILLTECLGKSRAGQRQHDMSHLFHGLLINLIRRSDCQSVIPEKCFEEKEDLESSWRRWADLEQRKRLAQLCFVWDVQHAVLFSQSLCMSAFELRSTLPCDQAVWESSSAQEWVNLTKTSTANPPHLLSVLKTYLRPQKSAPTTNVNAISRVVVLHGLMSVSWDMTRRDQTSLGLLGNGIVSGSWRDRLGKAYDAWKADFDTYKNSVFKSLDQSSPGTDIELQHARRECFARFVVAYESIYHAAHIILLAEILDLQIFAGARHILGRPVSRVDYSRSQKVVKQWAIENSSDASRAVVHATSIIKSAVEHTSFVEGDLFHHPWTLILATLAIWSFYHVRPRSNGNREDDDDEVIWDVKEDMTRLLETVASVGAEGLAKGVTAMGKNCTAGLTTVVVNSLSKIRWGVIHDGMLILKGLVPWRLVNSEDSG